MKMLEIRGRIMENIIFFKNCSLYNPFNKNLNIFWLFTSGYQGSNVLSSASGDWEHSGFAGILYIDYNVVIVRDNTRMGFRGSVYV
jgi:hypothetical protein